MSISDNYPAGVDLVWAARDKYGRLAALVTAGEGPVPKEIIGDDGLPDCDLEAEILRLPVASKALLHVQVPRPDDFIAMAERGFFVYDWRDVNRTATEASNCYELVASPTQAVSWSFLDVSLSRLGAVQLVEYDFSNAKKLCLKSIRGFVVLDVEE
ncbi:hypothetical protein ABU614_13530 [Lysobacter firmicutimachus]|uniref:Uncharacterized protein n=1 Tax=Lysobacter firmicutimachus TaxID=1792846 RepID=A0AAU8MQ62_9GAMM